jgi:hypothetical protein
MKVRVPFVAPLIPPDMGVSMNTMSFFLASAANSLEAIGEIVEVSRINVPFLAFLKIPSGPLSTSSTSLVAGTLVTM